MRYSTQPTHISQIAPGDLVVHNGELRTVCQVDIHTDPFMGTTIFGDSYRIGNKPVQKAIIQANK